MGDEGPRERQPIPLLLWMLIAVVVVIGFMFALRVVNPPEMGMTPPTPDVIVPTAPRPAPLPDVKPGA